MAQILLLSIQRSNVIIKAVWSIELLVERSKEPLSINSGAVLLAKVCASQAYETFANEREEWSFSLRPNQVTKRSWFWSWFLVVIFGFSSSFWGSHQVLLPWHHLSSNYWVKGSIPITRKLFYKLFLFTTTKTALHYQAHLLQVYIPYFAWWRSLLGILWGHSHCSCVWQGA
jgi:hypothetical protein